MVTQMETTFTVLVYRAEEDGYWAEVPELPGCLSQGNTLDELERNIREATALCLQAHIEDEGEHASRKIATWNISLRADNDH